MGTFEVGDILNTPHTGEVMTLVGFEPDELGRDVPVIRNNVTGELLRGRILGTIRVLPWWHPRGWLLWLLRR